MAGPATVMVFAIIGWLFKRYQYSVPAAVIGILLGNMAESNLIYSIKSAVDNGHIYWSGLLLSALWRFFFASLMGGKLVHWLTNRVNAQADA